MLFESHPKFLHYHFSLQNDENDPRIWHVALLFYTKIHEQIKALIMISMSCQVNLECFNEIRALLTKGED